MEFDLKWVHVARYELILKLDGALWLRIISGPLLTLQRHMGADILSRITISSVSGLQWKKSSRTAAPPCPACACPERSSFVRLGLALRA